MNTTRTTIPVAISVPLTALLMAVVAFHVLGPAQAAETPRPQPGVSPIAPAAGHAVGEAPGNRYLGKQQELLNSLDGTARLDPAADEPQALAVVNGVPRDLHGGAYLGKQPALLRHLY